jgi:hypothetical protein
MSLVDGIGSHFEVFAELDATLRVVWADSLVYLLSLLR